MLKPNEPNAAFLMWLKSIDYKPFVITGEYHDDVFVRIPKGEQFVFVYHDRTYKNSMSEMPKELEYEGIFFRGTEKLYNVGLNVRDNFPELVSDGANKMAEDLQAAVRKRVEEVMGYSKATEPGTVFLSRNLQKQMDEYNTQHLYSDARRLFLNGETSETYQFRSSYQFVGWRENDMLTYIASPDYFVEYQFKDFWTNKKDDIYLEYAQYEAVKDELERLEDLEDSPLHRTRDVMKVANATDAKKLVVTVNKEGIPLTFKIEANELRRDPSSYYGTWNIEAKDRRLFEETYGRHAHFTPEEITDISYCGKSIYSAEPYIPTPAEEQGMTMYQ